MKEWIKEINIETVSISMLEEAIRCDQMSLRFATTRDPQGTREELETLKAILEEAKKVQEG